MINEGLSQRQKDILLLKMNGMGDKEIAQELSISYHTVRSHIDRARYKFSCKNTFQLIALVQAALQN